MKDLTVEISKPSTYRLAAAWDTLSGAISYKVTLEAGGWEVVKKYVELGLGISIVTSICLTGNERLAALPEGDVVGDLGVADGAEILAKRPGDAPVSALAWSAGGSKLAFACEDERLDRGRLSCRTPSSTFVSMIGWFGSRW